MSLGITLVFREWEQLRQKKGRNMVYEMEIAGLKRQLPLCPINDELYIGAFIMFGDVEITVATAKELLAKAPEFDVLISAEAKGLHLYPLHTKCCLSI